MADALPDAPWATPDSALPDAPWAAAAPASKASGTPKPAVAHCASPITDIPKEAYKATADAIGGVGHFLNPFSSGSDAPAMSAVESGIHGHRERACVGCLACPAAPLIGAARSVIGHPLDAADDSALRSGAVARSMARAKSRQRLGTKARRTKPIPQ
jgi:hypothetical protein